MDEFEEAPDLTKPIDTYFAKQERCRLLLVNSEYPIQEHTMILKATQHLGKNPSLSKKSVKFCKLKKQADLEKCKTYYRAALRAIKQENKCLGADPDHQVNSVIATNNTKEAVKQKARDGIVSQMSKFLKRSA